MENILAELWPYLLLFYLIDGIRSLGACEMGLSSCTGATKRFRLTTPGSFFLNVLPGGFFIRADQSPIILTESALYLPTDKNLTLRTITPEDFFKTPHKNLQTLSVDGKDILLNDKKLLTLASDIKAAFWTANINAILTAKVLGRRECIQKFYHQRLDLKQAEADWSRHNNILLFTASLCQTLFLLLFILLPLYLYTDLLNYLALSPLLLVILLNFIAIIGMVGYALHQIYGRAIGKVITELLLMLLSPLSIPQALLHLSSNRLHQYDWLVAAALLGSEGDFYSHTRQRFHYIDKMKEGMDDPLWGNFWNEDQILVTKLVEQSGRSLDAIYEQPMRQDNASASYCPVCHSEYLAGYDMCHDCEAGLRSYQLS